MLEIYREISLNVRNKKDVTGILDQFVKNYDFIEFDNNKNVLL
jgi:hypothetical protein